MSEMLASEAATAPACPPVAPPRVVQYFRCKCGAVEIELAGEPFLVNNCHCTMCIKVAHYLDAKGGGISSIAHTTGVAKAMFFLENVSYMKGKALLRPLKIGPEGKNVRSYTSCCNTLCNADGGAGNPPFGFRPFNRNAIVNADGTPFAPPDVLNTQGETNPKWPDVPEPKCAGFPLADEKLGLVSSAEWGAGALLGDTTPGLYTDPATVDEFVPVTVPKVNSRFADD